MMDEARPAVASASNHSALGAASGEPSETSSGFSVSLNAKGHVQFEVKLRYATPDELLSRMDGDLNAAVTKIRLTVANLGMTLAG